MTDGAEIEFAVHDEYITLGQLLKLVGAIGSGGEAKHYLANGLVKVNGEPETRRGRKLRPGDRIESPDEAPILIIAAAGRASGPGQAPAE